MRTLANAFRIVRFAGSRSARTLASEYEFSGQVSLAELFQTVMGPYSFHRVKRFFVLVLENRSFDHMLGFSRLQGVDAENAAETAVRGLSGIVEQGGELRASESNVGKHGVVYHAAAPTEPALEIDPRHEFENMREQIGWQTTPMNQGYVKSFEGKIADAEPDSPTGKASPGVVMRCFRPEQVPVLTTLAREYAVCDRWFASAPLPTWPNQMFIHAATSGGRTESPGFGEIALHFVDGYEFKNGTIFDRLEAADLEWQVYEGDEYPVSWAFAGVNAGDISDMDDFFEEIFEDDFPYRYVFIEPEYDVDLWSHYEDGNSQHASLRASYSLRASTTRCGPHPTGRRARSSSSTTREAGSSTTRSPPRRRHPPTAFHRLSTSPVPRVPAVIVSPWIPRGTVRRLRVGALSRTKICWSALSLQRSVRLMGFSRRVFVMMRTCSLMSRTAPLGLRA